MKYCNYSKCKEESIVDTLWIDETKLDSAVELLRSGEVVAFPTETVYGLGADATNNQAVKKIFEAKGRPSDNPLIVHLSNKEQVYQYAKEVPEEAEKIMDAFWPGPITIILNVDKDTFAETVTAGLTTVGLRMPNHPLASKLIELTGRPLAAPSANTSGKPSPTVPDHVYHDLNGKIAGIVQGGKTGVGLESTVLDLSNPNDPVILRPGGISREQVLEVLDHAAMDSTLKEGGPKAPGMKYKHYSPDEAVIIVDNNWETVINDLLNTGEKIGILANDEIIGRWQEKVESVYSIGSEADNEDASRLLYSGLRYFEETAATVILAEARPKEGIGLAYMNRLEKAAGKSVNE